MGLDRGPNGAQHAPNRDFQNDVSGKSFSNHTGLLRLWTASYVPILQLEVSRAWGLCEDIMPYS